LGGGHNTESNVWTEAKTKSLGIEIKFAENGFTLVNAGGKEDQEFRLQQGLVCKGIDEKGKS